MPNTQTTVEIRGIKVVDLQLDGTAPATIQHYMGGQPTVSIVSLLPGQEIPAVSYPNPNAVTITPTLTGAGSYRVTIQRL